MKKKIHPKYHKIKVEMTDGSQFETKSTWGSEGEILKLDIDPLSHSAWTGGKPAIISRGIPSKPAPKPTIVCSRLLAKRIPATISMGSRVKGIVVVTQSNQSAQPATPLFVIPQDWASPDTSGGIFQSR